MTTMDSLALAVTRLFITCQRSVASISLSAMLVVVKSTRFLSKVTAVTCTLWAATARDASAQAILRCARVMYPLLSMAYAILRKLAAARHTLWH